VPGKVGRHDAQVEVLPLEVVDACQREEQPEQPLQQDLKLRHRRFLELEDGIPQGRAGFRGRNAL
jgi:hypothetical protein